MNHHAILAVRFDCESVEGRSLQLRSALELNRERASASAATERPAAGYGDGSRTAGGNRPAQVNCIPAAINYRVTPPECGIVPSISICAIYSRIAAGRRLCVIPVRRVCKRRKK